MSDLIIVGGGVIGLTLAWKLAEQGAEVQLIEQGQLGREASWAGAGMLPPADLQVAQAPLARLRALSHPLWPAWSEQLLIETGIDNGYVDCGALELVYSTEEMTETELQLKNEGVEFKHLFVDELRQNHPVLSDNISAVFHIPAMGQVRNPRHLKALVAAAALRGVKLIEGEPVSSFETSSGKIKGVRTPLRTYRADQVCITTGAWSAQLGQQLGLQIPVRPVRGQIALLRKQPLPFTHILQHKEQYLVPRPDGRILIGSTMEEVGFVKSNTVTGISGLLRFATETVPALKNAELERTWSGLRPGSPDGIPFLGQAPGCDNLYYACGHFRDGLQLSAGTALVMSRLILGQEPGLDLAPYSLERKLD
ncbi:MAG: glycine oxidase ThiO [Planctomycetaceae bacterium]